MDDAAAAVLVASDPGMRFLQFFRLFVASTGLMCCLLALFHHKSSNPSGTCFRKMVVNKNSKLLVVNFFLALVLQCVSVIAISVFNILRFYSFRSLCASSEMSGQRAISSSPLRTAFGFASQAQWPSIHSLIPWP